MSKYKKVLYQLNNLLSGIIIITLGIIFINLTNKFYRDIIYILAIIFLFYVISQIINFIINKNIERNRHAITRIIINLIFSIILLTFPKVRISIIPVIFSFYFFINAIVKYIDFIIYKDCHYTKKIWDIFVFIFMFIFSFIFLKISLSDIKILFLIFGFYSILLGLNRIFLFIYDIISDNSKLKFRLALPLFLESIIPPIVYKRMRKNINKNMVVKKENKKTDLEILIHFSNYGFMQFGHVDMCYKGIIYSYGNYDKTTRMLNSTIGDGVLYKVEREKYINFETTLGRKAVISFGVELTKKQEEKLNKILIELNDNLIPWYNGAYYHLKKYKYSDYTSKLYNSTNAQFYKFKSGRFKKYFSLSSNCTMFLNYILNESGINILKFTSIQTPGMYYDYLNSEYKYKKSKVVSKIIYDRDEEYDKNKIK